MKEIKIKKYVTYSFGIAIFIFILNKLYFRSLIVEKNFPEIFQVITFSLPNAIEAIIGTLILTGLIYQANVYFSPKFDKIEDLYVHLLAVSLAAIYVISQELKFHNLGGNNVYDPNDLVASILGSCINFCCDSTFWPYQKCTTKKINV